MCVVWTESRARSVKQTDQSLPEKGGAELGWVGLVVGEKAETGRAGCRIQSGRGGRGCLKSEICNGCARMTIGAWTPTALLHLGGLGGGGEGG